jgi:putative phosphoesterase
MKILVISDSHIGQRLMKMPDEITKAISLFDHVIHAGDFTSYSAYMDYFANPDFYCVSGNMDDYNLKAVLPSKLVLSLSGLKIGITHGWGSHDRLSERILNEIFFDVALDILIHGHSHHPESRKTGSLLILNPGSLVSNIGTSSRSYAVLDLEETKAPKTKIVSF